MSRWGEVGSNGTSLFAISRVFRMTRVLARMLDDNEFFSPFGIRSISRAYRDNPYVFESGKFRAEVRYMRVPDDRDQAFRLIATSHSD